MGKVEKKEKKHYAVYYVGKGTGCYAENYQRTYLGNTWAVSGEKACSNVRFRYRDEKCPNGGYANDMLGDAEDMGCVEFSYEAEEI